MKEMTSSNKPSDIHRYKYLMNPTCEITGIDMELLKRKIVGKGIPRLSSEELNIYINAIQQDN